jgi:hypothetical protein
MRGLSNAATLLAVVSLMPWAGGCASLAKPSLQTTSNARTQQRRAVRFDPYPQPDIGSTLFREALMDGSRPRDYNEPVTEVRRSRWWSPMQ